MAGLYLHIPYCKHACAYCNFHFSTQHKHMPKMINAMCEEITLRSKQLNNWNIQTIYLGGGTPSLLPKKLLSTLLHAVRDNFNTHNVVECTLEANPEDVNPSNITHWQKLGITRISLGIQSFNDQRLQRMGRIHNAKQGLQAIQYLQDTNLSISIDLIYGSENTLHGWKKDLQQTFDLNIPHFSAYALTVEPKTALYHQVQTKQIHMPPSDQVAEQMEYLQQQAQKHGYQQYEVSAFAKNNQLGKHNHNYWTQSPYLGIGPSAHSYFPEQKIRLHNIAHNQQYINALEKKELPQNSETLTPYMQWTEYLLTRLRTYQGINLNDAENFLGQPAYKQWIKKLPLLITQGLGQQKQQHLSLSPKGLRVVDGVIDYLLQENAMRCDV